MPNEAKANPSIECTVQQCAHHCCKQNYCALDHVKIGTHEQNPTVVQCVDCESFMVKTSDSNCEFGCK